MDERKRTGMIFAILGLLLFCSVCPLALNSLVLIATGNGRPSDIVSLYGSAFPMRIGDNLTASVYVIAAQLACATVLALAILVAGATIFVRSSASAAAGKKESSAGRKKSK